ncbi:MBL fold metallo-hydrolase RNA specificity domain-containing protein [Marinimicrobium alkaliphilum]|uniref:MBL fold metallo-hydrolase RNA specificity domain-containing protein n=1 Tax=Marinimicrobium alkaliphilum TaxID=2202654 RepID=UPI000DBA238B|nr:MBL fold metallo-hydrolase [Marinimicrobium alkaliphilum]
MTDDKPHKITFLGAAQQVTGSCHLLETGGERYLLDCGMLQGEPSEQPGFTFKPASIDAVILSHAHLDHSGLLPQLVREGFGGAIYCTPGTQRLLKILLEDAAGLYLRDLEYDNLRRERAGKPLLEARYTREDVAEVLNRCEAIPYGELTRVSDQLQLTFYDAGHILGASVVELGVGPGNQRKTLVFSGDLGNPETSLMRDPTRLEKADVVLMEGTYGDRDHRGFAETVAELEQVLTEARASKGNVLIPAFAVGRTQELLFQLGHLYQQGKLDGWQVFVDSPMAKAVTEVYEDFRSTWDRDDRALLAKYKSRTLKDFLPCLSVTESVDESIQINRIKNGAIIIAGSGMCTGGRIRHHFKHRLWKANTHVVFAGFQARGTLGRMLVDGAKLIKLFGQEVYVRAQIHTIGGFSAHAGQSELLAWAGSFVNKPKFYLVHGEEKALDTLAEALWEHTRIEATVAAKGATVHF